MPTAHATPTPTPSPAVRLPSPVDQAERLVDLGVHRLAGLDPEEIRAAAQAAPAEDGLLVIHPDRAPASALAPLVHHGGKKGFVVVDMTDLDEFVPIRDAAVPSSRVYVLTDLDRGDSMAGWSPEEALPAILGLGRTPLTVGEGLFWLLQQPEVLERNHCFMTIGSRLRKPTGRLDARTPAIWISNGTGRDGAPNRDAPKVGWCWAGNRHSWLGFASAATRQAGHSRAEDVPTSR
ncbi:MAG: DUF5701 family protein [Lapillicoccus sp.]